MNQDSINEISQQKTSNNKKISLFRDLFQKENIKCFSDFDDTISINTCLLYSKVNYLSKRGYTIDQIFERLKNDFTLNSNFEKIVLEKKIKNIVIISTNNSDFIKLIINYHQSLFSRLGINIIGVVGQASDFHLSPKDKINLLPSNCTYISDIFEYKNFKGYDGFICVDKYSIVRYCYILCKKILFYLLFCIKNV